MNYRQLAKDKPCMIRLEGCDGGRTTVLCHYRLSPYCGTGIKPDDFVFGAWGCQNCHDIVDGRKKTNHDRTSIRLAHSEAVHRTQMAIKELKERGDL